MYPYHQTNKTSGNGRNQTSSLQQRLQSHTQDDLNSLDDLDFSMPTSYGYNPKTSNEGNANDGGNVYQPKQEFSSNGYPSNAEYSPKVGYSKAYSKADSNPPPFKGYSNKQPTTTDYPYPSQYELSSLNRIDSHPLPQPPIPQPQNKSRENQAEIRDQQHPYGQDPQYPQDPFKNANHQDHRFLSHSDQNLMNPFRSNLGYNYSYNSENPFQEPSDKPYPDLTPETEFDRFKTNERNRIKQLRRKPRFHYTKLPYFTILVTTIQIIVFIVELANMAKLTGSAFQTQPYFNPMLGPSTYVLINMGARYVPCMHQIAGITNDTTIQFPCPNSTTVDTNVCNLSELCGLSGVPIVDDVFVPDQWYRIFVPIFLHAGFLHIIFNLLLQVTMGTSIERSIGIIKYAVIYILSGMAGFLLGANFSPNGIASTGCSGALFGLMATNILAFVYCGRKNTNMYGTKHYVLFICIMVAEILVSFVLGLLPGLDNFSHIGGFAMGLLIGIVLLPDPFFVYIDGVITYNSNDTTLQQFINGWNPAFHWENKIPMRFFIWCGVRVVCFVLVIVFMVELGKNFFERTDDGRSTCSWCRYINCIPVHGWCDIGNVSVQTVTTPKPSPSEPISSQGSALPNPTTSTISMPTSIENSGTPKRRSIQNSWGNVFNTPTHPQPQLDANSYIHHQNVGLSFYILFALLTFTYFRKKISGSTNS
jgi:membrane associated rhomboid family serine protease